MTEPRFRLLPTQTDLAHQHVFGPMEWFSGPQSKMVTEWCLDQFGETGPRWYPAVNGYYCFRNENDASAFRIRWC